MLKGIDPVLSAELVYVLMLMGHGDDLVVCDVNHPAATIARQTTYGKLLDLPGCELSRALEAILTLFPIDDVETQVSRMQVVNDPEAELPIFDAVRRLVEKARGRAIVMQALERFDFYKAAKQAFAVVRTSDPGPYGCFIIKKGVVHAPSIQ